MKKIVAVMALACIPLGGCAAVALTALGIGMATGVSHTLSGMVYKTFTTPQAQVEKATYGALNRMQVKVVNAKRDGSNKMILAKAGDRDERGNDDNECHQSKHMGLSVLLWRPRLGGRKTLRLPIRLPSRIYRRIHRRSDSARLAARIHLHGEMDARFDSF